MSEIISWPPSEEQIKNIAISASNKSNKDKFKVLLYCDNPSIMIFDPIHFGNTEYKNRVYKTNDNKQVEVIIGKED